MTLSEIKAILAERDLRLTKSLGQNFLHDQNQLRKIIAAAELTGQDKVLEIGPGLGALTELLLQHSGQVLAIEKDQRLVEILNQHFRGVETHRDRSERGRTAVLNLVHEDALDYLRCESRDWTSWKMVSNLPYSVASPILVELAQSGHGPRRIVVTLQIEVAHRLLARPSQADYGVLTLLVQLDYTAVTSFKIPASCFFPQPDVDSACVCLARRPEPLLAPAVRGVFCQIVKRSFSQRRKMMFKLLRADWAASPLEKAFNHALLEPQTRAESVSLEQFVRLAQVLAANSNNG